MFENIPLEMRTYPQWIVWRLEDRESHKPTKVPYSPLNHRRAKTNDPSTWATYEQALHVLQAGIGTDSYNGIGFMLTAGDPFAFVDLDDPYEEAPGGGYKHAKPDEVMQKQIELYRQLNSYAERSPSGKGLHIIAYGAIPSGRRRSAIEVYTSDRFMTMTGDVYNAVPIRDCNEDLNTLWAAMAKGPVATGFYAGLDEAKYSNEQVLEIAGSAANNEKFHDLFYHGDWAKYYPSQSEADLALVDIIAFYSENRQQVQELFLSSALGQREKSRAQYRINYMLNKCFDRMLPPIDIDGLRNQLNEAIVNSQQHVEPAPVVMVPTEQPPTMPAATNPAYSCPPGLVGELAQYIYAQAPRPVAEIALAGALALMSGIVGRAYNVSGTGLNQYVLLLAATGTGKEAMARGIDKLMNEVYKSVPAAVDFIGPGEIASPQALMKYMSKTANSFVSTVGEFGIYLQQMANVNAPPHMVGLRRMMLDLYNKSGEGNILKPSIYSDRDKNTASVLAPAFTLLGESTPEKFYEGLHEGLITEGLLPRFTIIEYHGPRVPENETHTKARPSFELIDKLATVCANALQLNNNHKAINVTYSPEAHTTFKQFNVHCDMNINAGEREVKKQLWSRAHMKVLKLAAVVAVGVNPYSPVITKDIADWAIGMILSDVRNLLNRFDAGEIGIDNDETKQLSKASLTIKEFVTSPWSEVEKYAGATMIGLHAERIIPYSYVQRRLASVAVFKKDRQGSSMAIKRALKTLAERGDLQEVSKGTLSKNYGTTSLCYMITNPKAFGL